MAQNRAGLKTEGRQPLKVTLTESLRDGRIDEDLIRKFVRASKNDLIEYQLRDEGPWTALDFRGGDTRDKFEAGAVLTLRLVKDEVPTPPPVPVAPVLRLYQLRGILNAVHSFNAPSDITLAQVGQEGCRKWPFFSRAAYNIYLDDEIKASQRKTNRQPLRGKELTEVRWQEVLRGIAPAGPISLGIKAKGQPFSDYRKTPEDALQALLWEHLQVAGGVEFFETELLDIADDDEILFGPASASVHRTFISLVDSTCEQLLMRADALRNKASAHRGFTDLLMTLAVLVARAKLSNGNSLYLSPDHSLVGSMAWGKAEHAVVYKTLPMIVTTEAKPHDPDAALAQACMEICALRDEWRSRLIAPGPAAGQKRDRKEMDLLSALKTYAVICTAVDYQLLLYDPNVDGKARLFLSGALGLSVLRARTSLDACKAEVKHLVQILAKAIVSQAQILDDACALCPGLRILGWGVPDADVEAALLDAQRNNLMTALQGEDEDGSEDGMSEDEEEDE